MKSFFGIVLLLSACIFANEFTFATWNLRWQSEGDKENGNGWDKRVKPISDVINFYDFDIVNTQENSEAHVRDLMPYLPNYEIIQVDTLEHNAILLKKGKFEVLEKGRFYLSKTPKKRSKGWDSKHTRSCTWVKLKYQETIFFVFNVHFDYHGKNAQFESAKLMSKQIVSIAGNNHFIFAGDLNFVENSPAYQELFHCIKLSNAKEKASFVYIPNNSYNYFNPQKYSKWQFDHIFTDKNAVILKYGILNEQYYDGEVYRYPSDHQPVMIKFQW